MPSSSQSQSQSNKNAYDILREEASHGVSYHSVKPEPGAVEIAYAIKLAAIALTDAIKDAAKLIANEIRMK